MITTILQAYYMTRFSWPLIEQLWIDLFACFLFNYYVVISVWMFFRFLEQVRVTSGHAFQCCCLTGSYIDRYIPRTSLLASCGGCWQQVSVESSCSYWQVFIFLKQCVSKSNQDKLRKEKSKWLREASNESFDARKVLLQTVDNR